MRKLGLVLVSALAFCLVVAAPALASYGGTGPKGTEGTRGTGSGGGTAFTGTNISIGVVILAALVVAGVMALLVSRRNQAASVTK
jgi:hypothetical protein